jgi:hypothetical protein
MKGDTKTAVAIWQLWHCIKLSMSVIQAADGSGDVPHSATA